MINSFYKAVILTCPQGKKCITNRGSLMLRKFFIYRIQSNLSCSKSTRKVSGLSRNAHLVRDIRVSQGICLQIQRYCCAVYDYVEKADLSKGYQNRKRKLGVTAHFSEIFGKKMPYILCILKLFLELWLLSYF